MRKSEKLRIGILYLYIFSLGIENWSPWGSKQDLFRPALIFAMLYVLLSTFLNFPSNYKVGNLKIFLISSLGLCLWLNIRSYFYLIENPTSHLSFNYTLLSCIIAFWLICNDLTRYPKLKNRLLYIFMANGIFLSILSFLRIGVDIGHMERESLLGNNANIIGLMCAISIIIITYILIENPSRHGKKRYFLLIAFPFLLQAMARTGSKGALLTLGVSAILYLLFLKKNVKFKIPIAIIGLIVFIMAYQYILQNEVMAERWNTFLTERDTTGRAERWEAAWDIFLKNPILGVGENGIIEIGKEYFKGKDLYDPHNVYFYILASGGIIGFIFLSIFLIKLSVQAYRSKLIWNSFLPVIFLFIMLSFWFKAGGGLNSKLVWAYFAILAYSINIQNNLKIWKKK